MRCFTIWIVVIAGLLGASVPASASSVDWESQDFSLVSEGPETCIQSGDDLRLCARRGGPVTECTADACVTYTEDGPVRREGEGPFASAAGGPVFLGFRAVQGVRAISGHISKKRTQARLKREAAKRDARRVAPPIIRTAKSIRRGGLAAAKRVLTRKVVTESARTVLHCFIAGIAAYLPKKDNDAAALACVSAAALRFVR